MPSRTRRSTAAKSNAAVVGFTTPRQSKYPAWTRLPYLILLEIFQYAASDHQGHARPLDHSWILGAALTCKAFYDPAIDLLYMSPPTAPPTRLRKLFEAVKANPQLGNKIRSIEAQSNEILDPKLMRVEFDKLVGLAPNIRDISVCGQQLKFNLVEALLNPHVRRLEMPPAVLSTVEEMNVALRSWTWDGQTCWAIAAQYDPRQDAPKKLARGKRGFGWLDTVHRDLGAFKSLKTLAMVNFDIQYPVAMSHDDCESAGEVGPLQIDAATVAGAVNRLKYLTNLALKDCTFVSNYFLTQIAGVHQLKRLVLEDVGGCDSGDLQEFLRVGGRHLRELEIAHCPNVRLGFLSVLETATPNLTQLLFEDVPGQLDDQDLEGLDVPAPQWPATLESLVMRSLCNWRVADCEVFLRSLVDTAREGGFMSLREVDVWCILPKLGWRDRATSRKYWGDEFAVSFLDRRGDAWKEFVRKKKAEGEKIPSNNDASMGLCQRVLFRLDDSRPTGNQLREADFLDAMSRNTGSSSSRAAPKKTPKAAASSGVSTAKGKGKGKGKATPKKAATPQKRKRASDAAQSFVVGRKRPRYDSDADEDFKVDQLAYDDEDGDDSSWSCDDEYD